MIFDYLCDCSSSCKSRGCCSPSMRDIALLYPFAARFLATVLNPSLIPPPPVTSDPPPMFDNCAINFAPPFKSFIGVPVEAVGLDKPSFIFESVVLIISCTFSASLGARDDSRQLQGQCNRNRPPARVRMERRGKSSPLFRRRERLCKPHSMQEKRTYRLPAASLNRSSRTATFGSDRCLSSTEPGLQTALVYPAESAGFLFFRYLRVGSDRIVDFFYRED